MTNFVFMLLKNGKFYGKDNKWTSKQNGYTFFNKEQATDFLLKENLNGATVVIVRY